MKLNAPDDSRTVHVDIDGPLLVVTEKELFPNSHSGATKWQRSRVCLTLSEAKKLAKFIAALEPSSDEAWGLRVDRTIVRACIK